MARDFSPITFFQRTPNALLGRYFHEKHDVLHEIDFDELEETRHTAEMIFQAFAKLPEPKQAEIEAECQVVESMCNQAGVTALIDEATDFHKNADFPEAVNQHASFHGKVMWTFLEHPGVTYWLACRRMLGWHSVKWSAVGTSVEINSTLSHKPSAHGAIAARSIKGSSSNVLRSVLLRMIATSL